MIDTLDRFVSFRWNICATNLKKQWKRKWAKNDKVALAIVWLQG